MGKVDVQINVSTADIDNTVLLLKQYARNLQEKCERLVEELAKVGIEVIEDNIRVEYDGEVRNFGDNVFFKKDIVSSVDGATLTLYVDAEPYLKEWETGSAIVNPLYMAEFGSGAMAVEGHRGTFPNQKHANQPSWFWRDMTGRAHISSGNVPSRPMQKAVEEITKQAREVAERVFR